MRVMSWPQCRGIRHRSGVWRCPRNRPHNRPRPTHFFPTPNFSRFEARKLEKCSVHRIFRRFSKLGKGIVSELQKQQEKPLLMRFSELPSFEGGFCGFGKISVER